MKKVIVHLILFTFISLSFASAATVLFADGFESGSLSAWTLFSEANATNWTANQTAPFMGNWYAQAQPLDNSPTPSSYIERTVSTTGYQNVTLAYYRQLVNLDVSDEFRVKWFDGTNWIILEQTGNSSANDTIYSFMGFNLPASANNNSNLKIRFECSANAMAEYCRVDNVAVTANLISSSNYYGYLAYSQNSTYYFYINSSAKTITFIGLNASNQYDNREAVYSSFNPLPNTFTKRINYLWFNGWFDSNYLYLNQYVGTGINYSANAVQTSPGFYQGNFVFQNVPYLYSNFNFSATVRINTTSQESIFDLPQYQGFSSFSPIEAIWQTGGHAYGPALFETKLVQNANQSVVNINLWVKYDLATQPNPTWVSPLIPA